MLNICFHLMTPCQMFSVPVMTLVSVEVIHLTHIFVSVLIIWTCLSFTEGDEECTAVSQHHLFLSCLLFILGDPLHWTFSGFHSYLRIFTGSRLLRTTINLPKIFMFLASWVYRLILKTEAVSFSSLSEPVLWIYIYNLTSACFVYVLPLF